MRLLEMIDLADMPGGVRELEPDALAMPAGRKAPALDHRHFVRHVRMRGIMGNRVRCRIAGRSRPACSPARSRSSETKKAIHEERTALNRTAFRAGPVPQGCGPALTSPERGSPLTGGSESVSLDRGDGGTGLQGHLFPDPGQPSEHAGKCRTFRLRTAQWTARPPSLLRRV